MPGHSRSWSLLSCLAVLGLLLIACSPAAAPAPAAKAPAAQTPSSPLTAPAPSPKPAAEQAKYGGILTIATQSDPPSFDLHSETSNVVIYPIGPAYNGLVRENPLKRGELIGELAEKWELSSDGKTFTFHLRNGVKWHDGKPLTARDAVFSLQRMREKQPYLEDVLPTAMKEALAVDDSTLRIDMNFPYAQLLRYLAMSLTVIMPEHVVKEKGDMKRTVVGTGAFKFKSYQSGVSVQLVKNADYFLKGLPYLDGVTVYPVKDASTRLAGFKTQRITFLANPGLTGSEAKTLRRDFGDKVTMHQWVGSYWFNLYMPNDRKPWSDERVRKAAFLAIDRQKSLQTVDQGDGRVGSFFPPELGGKTDEQLKTMPGFRQPKDADIAEAKKLMAEAGYSSGFKTQALHRRGRAYEDAAVFVKDQLKQIGIDVEVYTKEDAAFYDTVYKRGYESHVHRHPLTVQDADTLALPYFKTGGARNFGVISDKTLDELIAKQMVAVDPKERLRLVGQVDDRLIAMAAQATLHWSGYWAGWWGFVKGFEAPEGERNHQRFDHIWLDK
ncbi:MAG: ABC transporter substrate-binding protein [Chloroflexi bacterium]|nr:ABC transporter substrate-binding protein [Chloroflexota bacterium]